MGAAQRIFDAIGAQLILHAEFGDVPPRVGEDYELIEILGAGGFGLICRARQVALRREVALKLFPLTGERDDTGVREALREARSLARLEHPGIVTVYAAGESELVAGQRLPCAFVEMRLISGRDLRAHLESTPRTAAEVLEFLLQAGDALAYAHAHGVVHRDFKPENLMVDGAGRATVIDFGLALAAEAGFEEDTAARTPWHDGADALGTRVTGVGLVRGTPGYMAPELSRGQPRPASDQFALAVVTRELLTGRHPFASDDDPSGPLPDGGLALFHRLRGPLDRAMAPAPADRFDDIAQLCATLRAYAADPEPDPASPEPDPGSQARNGRRRSVGLGLAAVLGLAALAIVGGGLDALSMGGTLPPEGDGASPPSLGPDGEPDSSEDSGEDSSEGSSIGSSNETGFDSIPPLAAAPPQCRDLSDWMGTWQVGSRVTWTEYAYQFDWRVDYELELSLGERCVVEIHARKFPPISEEGQVPGPPLELTVQAVAVPNLEAADEQSGWRLPLRMAFPGDGRSYSSDESYETLLVFDRDASDEARLGGAFRKVNADGYWIRLGLLEGSRAMAPAPSSITTEALPCPTRCRVECAGADAERACVTGGCAAAPGLPTDVCGPPSPDFIPPMRARATRRTLLAGDDPFEQALSRGSRRAQLAICPKNAARLAGRWLVWSQSGEGLVLDLRHEGCALEGSARPLRPPAASGPPPSAITVEGTVTAAGTWIIDAPVPAPWFVDPLVLTGTGRPGVALGILAAESDAEDLPLRALRLPEIAVH